MKHGMLVLGTVVSLVMAGARQVLAQDVTVIVNDAAPVTSLSMDELGKVFQKQRLRWPNGLSVEPVDLAETNATRERFSHMVFAKSTAQMKAWWQTQVFDGRTVPPVEMANEDEVVNYVRLHAGAIAYVSPTARLGDGVRRLRVVR